MSGYSLGQRKPLQSIARPAHLKGGLLQRQCACGQQTIAGGECEECKKSRLSLQRRAGDQSELGEAPPLVHEVLRSSGQPLDPAARTFFEPRFGRDFSQVRVHTSAKAAESAHAVHALAYTLGRDIVFRAGRYAPTTNEGKHLLAHELTHIVQQESELSSSITNLGSDSSPAEANAEAIADAVLAGGHVDSPVSTPSTLQRRAAPYIKKITVHLAPSQAADIEWEGTPPADATGSDHFTVSTGKGYGDPDDPPGTCKRQCCSDPLTQCAPPWNQPTRVGSCCTYYGNNFWTGTPEEDHNGWQWWTPIQPYYGSRGIALHQHTEVTGEPIGHGCVRMEEPNAKRIYDYSNGRRTNVTIDGRAAPVACEEARRCPSPAGSGPGSQRGALGGETEAIRLAQESPEPVPGLEGVMT